MTIEISPRDLDIKLSEFPQPEVVLLPPEEIEETHPQENIENLLPSPMSVFHEDRKKQHLAEQKLVAPKKQESNNGKNPFFQFFSWVMNTFFGGEVSKEFTPEEQEKIHLLFDEAKKALQAITEVVDEDDNKNFEQLLHAIQKKRELEQKRTVALQGEALTKARIERDSVQQEITKKADQVMAQFSRKNLFEKFQQLLTPLAGILSSLQLPVKWGAGLFAISALSAAHVGLSQPLGQMASTLLDLAIYLPLMGASAAGVAPVSVTAIIGFVLLGAQALTTAIKAKADQTLKSYQGDLGVLNNEKRKATEKLTSIGDKAAKFTEQYHKELGALSRQMEEMGELIQLMFSR
jgi:hypothetical protein